MQRIEQDKREKERQEKERQQKLERERQERERQLKLEKEKQEREKQQKLERERQQKLERERYIIITGIKERAHELYSMSKELLRDINGKKVCICVGGANRKKENLKLMENDVKLIISTPQRIIEYIKKKKRKKKKELDLLEK